MSSSYQGPPPGHQGGFPPPAAPEPKRKKPIYKRWWFITVVVLIVIGAISSAAGGGKKSDTGNDTPAAAAPAAPAATSPAAAAPAPAPTKSSAAPAPKKAAPPPPPAIEYPGKKDGDKAVKAGESIKLSGWTTTATPLKAIEKAYIGKFLCTTVTMANRDTETQDWNMLSWKLQTPNGAVLDSSFTGDDKDLDIGGGGLAPGGKVSGRVCFDDKKAGKGTYVVFWQPDIFSSEDRGAWINKR